ncbi:MAG: hypothetical protein M3003_06820, partial [Candidatus Dormibacteraeota bacterium]|nr:hypothetical protein [Candidatus Dormibacteraeota bacterium]
EFREQLRTQASTFVTRNEIESEHRAMNDRMTALESFRDKNEGKSSGQAPIWAFGLTIAGSVGGALLLHFLTAPK